MCVDGSGYRRRGRIHAGQRRQPLLTQAQRGARGHQKLHSGCSSQEFGQQVGALDQMFEVIQHQEHLFVSKVAQQPLLGVDLWVPTHGDDTTLLRDILRSEVLSRTMCTPHSLAFLSGDTFADYIIGVSEAKPSIANAFFGFVVSGKTQASVPKLLAAFGRHATWHSLASEVFGMSFEELQRTLACASRVDREYPTGIAP